jgi:hypothetical protein
VKYIGYLLRTEGHLYCPPIKGMRVIFFIAAIIFGLLGPDTLIRYFTIAKY